MQEAPVPPSSTSERSPLTPRALWSLALFVLLTFSSLTLAWWLPNDTWLHFAWVTQAVPVLYVVLMWWGCTDLQEDDDGR